jgi:autotransporter translocation and assembly factor TamB
VPRRDFRAAAGETHAQQHPQIQSLKVNSGGTITIVFVPVQAGTATLEVTVPTGTIARHEAAAAKNKKCRKGQVRIKGTCRPKDTLTGRVTAKGLADVPLKLTVKASKKVKAALRKGKTVSLTAKLSYKFRAGWSADGEGVPLQSEGQKETSPLAGGWAASHRAGR